MTRPLAPLFSIVCLATSIGVTGFPGRFPIGSALSAGGASVAHAQTAKHAPAPIAGCACSNTIPISDIRVRGGGALSPASGFARNIAIGNFTGFQAAEPVFLYWDRTNSSTIARGTADGKGNAKLRFYVPQSPHGDHTVIAVGQTSGITAQATFTVEVQGVISPSYINQATVLAGKPDASFLIAGFAPGESFSITWSSPSGPVLATGTADMQGTAFSRITIPPQASPAAYGVYAVGANGDTVSVPLTVSVTSGCSDPTIKDCRLG